MAKKRFTENEPLFAAADLRAQDAKAFQVWFEKNAADWEEYFSALLNDSYRVTIKYDYNNMCVSAAVTNQDEKHKNAGIILMSRGTHAAEVVMMSAYKIYVMYPDEPLPLNAFRQDWG